MLPISQRITKIELQNLIKTYPVIHAGNWSLRIAPSTDGLSHAAVKVPKTVHKHAVVRNRIKRIILEALHTILPTMSKPSNVIVWVKKDISAESYESIKSHLLESLNIKS